MVGGDFTRLDAHAAGGRGTGREVLVAGYDTRAARRRSTSAGSAGRQPARGPRSRSSRTGRAQRDLGVGDRIRVATPTAGDAAVVGIFRFSSGLSFGGQGFAAMPLELRCG